MIQIYKRGNTDFEHNGDITIFPAACILQTKLNGAWELSMLHPLDDEGRWKYIEEESVICAPTFQGSRQCFRISEVEKKDTEIAAVAYPLFFDSAKDCFLLDTRPEIKTGQQALDIMLFGTKYSGESDITTASTAYFIRRNFMDAVNGEDEPTFIQRWGGEILYDNYKIIINERVGGDYGTEIRYGKNMNGISYRIDMSEVITRIIPVSYNGYTLSGNEPWVDSPNIGKYATVYTKEMKFENVKIKEDASEDDGANGITVCENMEALYETLIQECDKQFAAGVDVPKVTIEVNMIDLAETKEYKKYKVLETVRLGDTVHCRHRKLDITTDSRVIELGWDCIRNVPESMKLGDFEADYFSELTATANAIEKIMGPGNTVVAERVRGVLNAVNTQLRYQKSIAKRQDVRAILFEDLDTSSPVYGAMSIGTQGLQIADKRTQDGRDWDWTTAFTAKGGYADVLVAGILSDKSGKSFWNLETGEMQLTGTFRQFSNRGLRSVDIANNEIRFFDWNTDGKYVGSIGAVKRKSDGRIGIEMWCSNGETIWIGYDDGSGGDEHIRPILSFDTQTPTKTPWIVNTVSGKIFSGISGGGVIVENGLIKDWDLNGTADGTIYLGGASGYKDTKVTVKDGLITGWTSI